MKKKTVLTSMLLILLMAVTMVFSGCGGEPATLEEMVADNPEIQEKLDALAESSGMGIEVAGNTVTYTQTYQEELDEATIEEVKPEVAKAMEALAPQFEEAVAEMVESTGIEDVSIVINYVDAAGAEIYKAEY